MDSPNILVTRDERSPNTFSVVFHALRVSNQVLGHWGQTEKYQMTGQLDMKLWSI